MPDDEMQAGGWLTTTLGELTSEQNLRVGPTSPAPVVLSSTKHFGLVPSNEYFRNRTIYSDDLTNYKRVLKDWFAYATNHLAEGSIGRQKRFDDSCVSPIYTVFSCTDSVYPPFLERVVKSAPVVEQYKTHEQATVDRRGAVRYRDFARVRVKLPPIIEQVKITEVLDTIDTTIRHSEAIIEKLKQVKQGLLNDVLTRGIDANGELRPPQSHAPHLYKESPLGWIPREWQLRRFREIGRAPQLGLMVRGASLNGMNVGLLKMGNLLTGNQLDLGNVEPVDARRIDRLDNYVLAAGDLLFNTRNTPELVGKTCSWRDCISTTVFDNNILRMQVTPSIGNGHFIASYMGGAVGRKRLLGLATGTTSVAAIYWKDLQYFLLPLPSPDEQEAIVERLDACDLQKDHEKTLVGTLAALKSGLMDDLLTGRVRVTPLLA